MDTRSCWGLTLLAERQRAAPERRGPWEALDGRLPDELVAQVAAEGEELPGQVEPLGQHLVAVGRDARVLTGDRLLGWRRERGREVERQRKRESEEVGERRRERWILLSFSTRLSFSLCASELD